MRKIYFLIPVLTLFLYACAGSDSGNAQNPPPTPTPSPPASVPNRTSSNLALGYWGSTQARLEVSDNGAHLELGCANADIPQTIVLDQQNSFSLDGTFVRESGPEPAGGYAKYSAHFVGAVQGTNLHLTLTYSISNRSYSEDLDLAFGSDRLPLKCRASVSTWIQVSEKTSCEALNPLFCKGLHGFAVARSGNYHVGPNASGQSVDGHITTDELTALSTRAQNVAMTANQTHCEVAGRLPGSSDTVTLTTTGNGGFAAYDWQGVLGRTCFRGQTSNAQSLHDELNSLLLKYYPSQF